MKPLPLAAIWTILVSASLGAPAEATESQRALNLPMAGATPDNGGNDLVLALAEDEKKRVPKDEEDKKKTSEKKTSRKKDDSDDDSCWATCLFDFMGVLFSGDDNETTADGLVAGDVGSSVRILGSGVLLSADSTQSAALQLWSGPGGEASGYTRRGDLIAGTTVDVLNHTVVEDNEWVEVQTRDGSMMGGWLPASSVDWVEHVAPSQPVSGQPTIIARRPAGLILGVDLAYFDLAGPLEVREEYKGGAHFGLSVLYVMENTVQVGLSSGYAESDGDPLYNYDYMADMRRDSPTNSRLQIVDTTLRLGQYLQVGSKAIIDWSLGAVYYWVRESADIDVLSLPSGLPVRSVHISNTRWRWGADVVLGTSYLVATGVHVGIQARGFWIPWAGRGLESLTLDFIDKKTVVGVAIGATVRFDAF